MLRYSTDKDCQHKGFTPEGTEVVYSISFPNCRIYALLSRTANSRILYSKSSSG